MRPHLAVVRQEASPPPPSSAAGGGDDAEVRPSLRDLSPEDVFRRLCGERGETLDDALLAAFRDLLTGPEESLAPAPEPRAAPQQVLLLSSDDGDAA